MSVFKKLFATSGILQQAGRGRTIRLPDERTGLKLELMHKQKLSNEYMGDLRVSGRNGGINSSRGR